MEGGGEREKQREVRDPGGEVEGQEESEKI